MTTSRRDFLKNTTTLAAAALVGAGRVVAAPAKPFFDISLAEWSLHKALFKGEITNLDFPRVAREKYGISTVEYVNQFFKAKAKDTQYLAELRGRCRDQGVTSHLIMVDGEGELGTADPRQRRQAVENHYKWLDAAAYLGCRTVRVNAFGPGSAGAVRQAAIESLRQLGTYARPLGLNVVVENHGGYTSDGQWLLGTIRGVDRPNVGILPDFGNFCVRRDSGELYKGKCVEEYDKYAALAEWLPVVKGGVSAKAIDFDAAGNCVETDYPRMLALLKKAGFRGYLGIEYEGEALSEDAGIRQTKALLERVGRAVK